MSPTLRDDCYLKRLEEPHIYDAVSDELYLLDEESFQRVRGICQGARDTEALELLECEGLLQGKARRLPVFSEGHSADPSLRYLEVQVTGRCDKACRHCYLGTPLERDMALKDFRALLEEFSRMQGLKVMVSGGEPACHPRFRDMASMLPDFPLRSVLITHGEWIGAREASWLRSCFHQVQVSLDGLEGGHDALRGKGSFARAAAAMGYLQAADVPVSVGTMVHEENLDQFEGMSALLQELGIKQWDIDVPCPSGRWKPGKSEPALLREMGERIRYAYGGGFHGGSGGLTCGAHLMTVAPDGKAAKCGFYFDNPVGNVHEEDLADIWSKVKHLPLEELSCDCDLIEECAGGCRYRAEVLEGSARAPDPVQCYARGVK